MTLFMQSGVAHLLFQNQHNNAWQLWSTWFRVEMVRKVDCLASALVLMFVVTDSVTSPAVMVLRNLVQNQLSSTVQGMADTSRETSLSIIARLSRKIDEINNTQARACIIWLVGQYAASNGPTTGPEGILEWAPDVLRKAARTFQQEVWALPDHVLPYTYFYLVRPCLSNSRLSLLQPNYLYCLLKTEPLLFFLSMCSL